MKKKVLIWILCIILLINSVKAAANATNIETTKESPYLEMYLYSWGLGETTDISLDDYFSIKRNPGEIYIYSAPPEISVYISQDTGIAKLTPSATWKGTKRLLFMITDGTTPEAVQKLKEYSEEPIKKIENEIILKQIEFSKFKNTTNAYKAISSLLDNLKTNLGPEAEVKATRTEKIVNVDVGNNIDIQAGFEKKVIGSLTTEKPKISININPKGTAEEEAAPEETGSSLIVIIPIVFIILSLLGIAGLYIKDHYSTQINRFFSKFKQKKKEIDLDKANLLKLKHILSEIEKIQKIENIKEASDKFFTVIKEFFKAVIKQNFAETYSGLDKKIMIDGLSDVLKTDIINFSEGLSNIKFSGKEIDKKEINSLISKAKSLISSALANKKTVIINEEKKQSWFVKLVNKIKEGKLSKRIKGAEGEVKKARKEIKKEKKKFELKSFLTKKLGLFKPIKEKVEEKIKTIEKSKKEEKEKLELEKEKEKLRKLKQEEKEIKKAERKKSWKSFLHYRFGLYKTKSELEEEYRLRSLKITREVREKQLEDARKEEERKLKLKEKKKEEEIKEERAINRKKEIRNFLHDKFGLYKTKEELEEEYKLKVIERARRTREANIKKREEEREKLRKKPEEELKKERALERKREFRKFLHDRFGFFKTEKELIEGRKLKAIEKARKAEEEKEKLRKIEIEKLRKVKEEKLRIREEEITRRLEVREKKDIKKILNEKFGFFKTPEEKKKEEDKKEELYKYIIEKVEPKEPTVLTKLKDKIKEAKFRPEYKEAKEKLLPKESIFNKTSALLRGASSKIKNILTREEKILGESAKRIEEQTREKFERLTDVKEQPKPIKVKDNVQKIEKLISNIKKNISKDLYKAKELYAKTTNEFKKIPEELPETTHQRLYNQLKPLKNEILRQSIPTLLKELKSNLNAGKIEKAKEIQRQIDDIYSYLAKQEGVSYTATSSLISMIEKANELIKANKISEAKELYKEITEKYDSLSQMEKQKYYKMVFDLYNKLIR